MENIDLLKQIPLFSTLSMAALETVAHILKENFYPAGEFLFHEHARGDRAYIIKSGQVEVLRNIGTPDETFLGTSDPGELIGEMAILEAETRSAGVRALQDTTTLEITGQDFESLITKNGAVGYQVVKMLSHRMRQAGDYRAEQRAQMARVEREMEIAGRIQADFLPDKLPQPPGWEIAAYFHPARAVGGDFYDAFPLAQNMIGFIIADVSGKGAGAALFMALVRSLIRAFAEQGLLLGPDYLPDHRLAAPAGVSGQKQAPLSTSANALNAVALANDYVLRNHYRARMFASLFLGVLEPTTGLLTYINAGHNPPILFGPDGIKEELEPTGPIVGMLPHSTFKTAQTNIRPGETLLGYTDGVTEARSVSGEFFGEERLRLLLAGGQSLSATAWLDQLKTAVRNHAAGAAPSDDITMLAIHRIP
ncbi:MAG: SpoIIE family protein phosphatase [Anaerolineae bacterium]|nr:SpoIIE family protein phosphatase [Anaerolineae bacterium]